MTLKKNILQVGSLEWYYLESCPSRAISHPPVVFLHTLVSQSYGWREVLPALAQRGVRALAPDWIGYGNSAKPEKQDFAYTSERLLQALNDFLDTLELTTCALVVQGFLGAVGLQYALRNPTRVTRLAILNTPLSTQARLPWKIKQMGLPLAGEMMTQDPLLVDRTLEGAGGKVIPENHLRVYRRPFLESSNAGRALLATIRNLDLPQAMTELEAGLPKWQAPTLLLWGTRDPWLPVAMAEATARTLPQGKIIPLDQAGHYPQEDQPEAVVQALVDFLSR
ncbi:alpha/beta fold hydrolase [Anthocerotibacter panamensis]|uniref:alpha/beta fold hydrolase n=1 Tax=Anthocerotibacter panamensis TaxID=2857077 RepID=UPI001C405FF8